jgi:acyl carrier protein phosphodiesterase
MNFLAHIYLSNESEHIKIGNFIADAIIGNKYNHLPEEIQKGIKLHRQIDSFTDAHEIVRKSKRRLHERYNHYDGVIIDILYDHYLAKNWANYSQIPLRDYTQAFYKILTKNYELLPDKTKHLMPHMIQDDWLYNYGNLDGIERVLQGMNRRTKNKSQMHLAIEDLKINYSNFENDFEEFFQQLINFTNKKIKEL